MKVMSLRSAAVSASRPGLVLGLVPLFFVLAAIVFPTDTAAESRTGSLVVLGLENQVTDEGWQDLRIGFGLTSLLAEKLYDTGLFQFIEEDPRQRTRLEERRRELWQGSITCREACFREEATHFGVTFIAIGRVTDFSTSGSKAFIGPVSTASRRSTVTVAIDLYQTERNEILTCDGKGSAATRAGALLFEFRGDAVAFDKSAIGPATEKALDKAVNCLLKQMKKRKWIASKSN